MALRENLIERITPMLEPGEEVQAVFVGQTASQYLQLLGLIPFLIANRYHVVAATDRRVAVFAAGKLTMSKPSGLVASLPRGTRLGPASGLWHVAEIGGVKLRVHKRFHKDMARADAVLPVG